jgi:hypothetical protein
MRAPEVFVLASTFLCPLTAFSFPSVSPFCAVPKLAWLNGFRSDSPLNLSSAEWLDFRPCLAADLVKRFPPRHAFNRSADVLRASPNELLPKCQIPVRRHRSCGSDCQTTCHRPMLFWVGFSCTTVPPVGDCNSLWARNHSVCSQVLARNGSRAASGDPVLEVASECRVSICALRFSNLEVKESE